MTEKEAAAYIAGLTIEQKRQLLTPENQRKFDAKVAELLVEQEVAQA